jgi:hypothetical protein
MVYIVQLCEHQWLWSQRVILAYTDPSLGQGSGQTKRILQITYQIIIISLLT